MSGAVGAPNSIKRLPLLPTLIVAAAVATMVGLGIWQLQRKAEKEALLARYEAQSRLPPIAWPRLISKPEDHYFRPATGFCLEVTGWRATAGRNAEGESGWSYIASCRTGAEGPGVQVDMGWANQPAAQPSWSGGPVSGVIVPDREHRLRLIAADPAPGLQPSAPPTRASIPNNHLLYALQWFFFAAAAAIIYALVLRRRWQAEIAPGGPRP